MYVVDVVAAAVVGVVLVPLPAAVPCEDGAEAAPRWALARALPIKLVRFVLLRSSSLHASTSSSMPSSSANCEAHGCEDGCVCT